MSARFGAFVSDTEFDWLSVFQWEKSMYVLLPPPLTGCTFTLQLCITDNLAGSSIRCIRDIPQVTFSLTYCKNANFILWIALFILKANSCEVQDTIHSASKLCGISLVVTLWLPCAERIAHVLVFQVYLKFPAGERQVGKYVVN